MSVREEAVMKIAQRLSATLGKDMSELSADTKFADLGLKSANVSQMTTFLEDAFDVEVPYMDFMRKKTIQEAADFIAELLGE
ncbi:MAG: acyl carrier protein [Defluviitaleaceae bacterium]|nr:acyl carrier protein [Defluviitaleaceae bacterium]